MNKLKIIGYWRNESDRTWPDPAWFTDESLTENEIEEMVSYLKGGYRMPYTAGGVSWCRFRCEEANLGSGEFTDGKYLWPEKLWHYVEKHKVRLPLKKNKDHSTDKSDEYYNEEFIVVSDWWKKQRGFNQKSESFLTPDDDGKLIIEFNKNTDFTNQISFLKKINKFTGIPFEKIKKQISKRSALSVNCKWTDYRDLIKDTPDTINIKFEK